MDDVKDPSPEQNAMDPGQVSPAPAGDPAPAPDPDDGTQSLLGGDPDDVNPDGGSDPEGKQDPGGDGTQSLLGDEKEDKPEEKKYSPEDVAKFKEEAMKIDMGDGVQFSDSDFDVYAEPLMALSGGDPSKIEPLMKAHVHLLQLKANAQIESQNNYSKALTQECRSRFGADLKRYAKDAREGGYKVFGPSVWNVLRNIPQVGNNPDVIERLALINQRFSTDTGVVPTKAPAASSRSGWISQMYGDMK